MSQIVFGFSIYVLSITSFMVCVIKNCIDWKLEQYDMKLCSFMCEHTLINCIIHQANTNNTPKYGNFHHWFYLRPIRVQLDADLNFTYTTLVINPTAIANTPWTINVQARRLLMLLHTYLYTHICISQSSTSFYVINNLESI